MTAHLFNSLNAADRLAINHGNSPGTINLDRWAVTYRCDPADVETALKVAENGTRKLPEEQAVCAPPAIEATEVGDEG